MTQFSLFGAEAATPTLDDLEGLLLAGAQWVRSAAGARLSVVVADRWRADALAAEFVRRAVGGADAVVESAGGFGVRTAFAPDLVALAQRWTRGANQGLPAGFQLGAAGLRLWAIAAGRVDDVGYLLATAEPDDPIHQAAGAQLSRLGVAAVSLAQRGGPGWRVTSARRLRRLVELLGAAPDGGAREWPVSSVPGVGG
ncbi:MAG TPA: hypothetical protein VGN18_19380 [Jatrophihabitans sp.]|jgi:hypothetical protein|uniref:hypothetical protein n=1 Tax=Jatrophihabitans sp. TaxID=1932789 RepID=UPI002DFB9C69|nr:hypothetical protein [Jatrophihabitans sp.]